MNHEDEVYEQIAAELDHCEDMSDNELHDAVNIKGACMWIYASGEQPAWTGDDRADRLIAEPICAGCPVRRECLELEFRTAGYATSNLWGPLPPEERRVAYLVWLGHRDGGQR